MCAVLNARPRPYSRVYSQLTLTFQNPMHVVSLLHLSLYLPQRGDGMSRRSGYLVCPSELYLFGRKRISKLGLTAPCEIRNHSPPLEQHNPISLSRVIPATSIFKDHI
uniref:Uncharacterized protein n=1 Tax=Photinus pyralis TaxID=7054 RepID=A0A1Y1N7F9_PHOPY